MAAEFGWFGRCFTQPRPLAKLRLQRTCLGSLGATTPREPRPSQKLIVPIFNHLNHPKFLNLGARNGSPLAMADLICLCLAAAPSYISSRSFYLPSTSNNYRISLGHSFLFPLYPLSLRGFEFSTSPVALAAIPSYIKALEVCCLLNVLHISIIIV